jgi:hypothetical protein
MNDFIDILGTVKHKMKHAEEAVIRAQAEGESVYFQEAQKALIDAENSLSDMTNDNTSPTSPTSEVQHAKDMLRNLKETQAAINAIHND